MYGGACQAFLLFLPNLFFRGCSQTKAGQINMNFGDFLNIHIITLVLYNIRREIKKNPKSSTHSFERPLKGI